MMVGDGRPRDRGACVALRCVRTVFHFAPAHLPAADPVLHMSAPVHCGRCPPGSGVMSDLFFFSFFFVFFFASTDMMSGMRILKNGTM